MAELCCYRTGCAAFPARFVYTGVIPNRLHSHDYETWSLFPEVFLPEGERTVKDGCKTEESLTLPLAACRRHYEGSKFYQKHRVT